MNVKSEKHLLACITLGSNSNQERFPSQFWHWALSCLRWETPELEVRQDSVSIHQMHKSNRLDTSQKEGQSLILIFVLVTEGEPRSLETFVANCLSKNKQAIKYEQVYTQTCLRTALVYGPSSSTAARRTTRRPQPMFCTVWWKEESINFRIKLRSHF